MVALDAVVADFGGGVPVGSLGPVADSGDVRLAWVLADLMRFLLPGESRDHVQGVYEQLVDVRLDPFNPWVEATNILLRNDTPAPPGYVTWKSRVFTTIDSRWAPFFDDPESELDYRLVGWGGVLPDERPLGSVDLGCPGGCIPALDDPAMVPGADADWYPDDAIVFGIVIDEDARAYPKNIMEVHELVLDTVGGTRIGMPYCTLCGSAQAYDLDALPPEIATPVLRTSGLLVRSNKLMYDLITWSAFDMFTGRAVTGPLRAAGVELERVAVVTSTWGAWKEAHPRTKIVARDGGIGRAYAVDPLRGRDDFGPIFPVGAIDSRLPALTLVLGVETPEGRVAAFPVDEATRVLSAGGSVELADIVVYPSAGGLQARLADGTDLATFEAFWFAWSQFHPATELWFDRP